IVWRGASGEVVAALPPAAGTGRGEGAEMVRSLGKRSYSNVFSKDGRAAFELNAPVLDEAGVVGTVAATMSLDALLTHHVPWWFAVRYQLEVIDGEGAVLAAKSRLRRDERGPSYFVAFDPPGHGLGLLSTLRRGEPPLARYGLAAAILVLALSAIASLWAMRRHIGRRLAAEEALRAEHALRKAMEDSLTVGLRARDMEGRIIYVNAAFCRMVGWTAEELLGSAPPMPYWAPEETGNAMARNRRLLAGEAPADCIEVRFRRKGGERFDALVYEAPLIDAQGRQSGWMGSVIDVTERKRADELARQQQERLQQTARLVTMGEMATTLAHELNQPLSAIASYGTGCLNMLKGAAEIPREELAEGIERLNAQAQRAGEIIRRVHEFVRKRETVPAPCALAAVIDDTTAFLAFDARKRGYRIVAEVEPDLPLVTADRIMIQQVLLNLARNGADAMATTPSERRELAIRVRRTGGLVEVAVADRGCGLAPDAADRLFTPFFTTKEEGMGMGLNICRSIVEHHEGRLWYEPREGGGSRFLFSLPLARDTAEVVAA
ncbi:MAG: PAS domain S-box protein, partial [Alphaproteobacteria bacterium]|nr:PAS domain S-box protein [Alphaproteobacteria bacterium]